MQYYIGTMGFSYADWSGVFYPPDMPTRNYLAYYSRIFNAAEIDSTFYGTPRVETVRRWAAVTPPGFKLCLKTPRQVTHDLGLLNAGAEMAAFLETVRLLEDRLGVILIQFPPSFTAERSGELVAFLHTLPPDLAFAVEIRDPSWYTPESSAAYDQAAFVDALCELGVAWAATEYPGLPRRIVPTADFLYVRWIGQHGTYKSHTHERVDLTDQLREWLGVLSREQAHFDALYGFFNNDYAGFAPGTANRFKALAGLPLADLRPPQQGTLF